MRIAVALLSGFLVCSAVRAQVEQLATSGDGQILLLHSHLRLQTEIELGSQGKIYRWQNGEWTRLAAAQDVGFAIVPPDVFSPFLSTDGRIAGWQVLVGCSLCQIIVAPPYSSEVSGVSLPTTFPRGTLRMSRNGRYFTGDRNPFSGAMYVDAVTGEITELPVDQFARPVVREVANDGTVLMLLTQPQDPTESKSPGVLSLWKPGRDPRPIYSENRLQGPTISGNGSRVAFESVVEGGADDDRRTLMVLDTVTGEQTTVSAMPWKDYRSVSEGFARPVWDGSGTKLAYRRFDDHEQPVEIALWDASTRESRTLLTSAEGFTSTVISDDGRIVWAATTAGELLRLNLIAGETTQILTPLGSVTSGPDGNGVPGSALLIRGAGFTKANAASDGDLRLPLVDATEEGLWVQVPWEHAAVPEGRRRVLIRREGNPFEAVVNLTLTHHIQPNIAQWEDPVTGMSYVKAVHADFRGLVSPSSPARRGETVHVYLTGLGPLDYPVPTGAPGPLDPQAHPLTLPVCRLGPGLTRLEMPYLGYAVGMVGIYQADLTIPDDSPEGTSVLYCTVSDSAGTWSGSARLSTTSAR
jgi:uncharacterized protein (TIGR03437 family)